MKIVARHRFAPLVALDDGSIIDTDELEVVGSGAVSGPSWEMDPEMEIDSRWEEIARADATNLGVTERRIQGGARTFRAPTHVRDGLSQAGVDTPLVAGKGLTLEELAALCEHDQVTGPAEQWMFDVLNKHEHNPDAEEELALFTAAHPELDMDTIDAATDDPSVTAAVEPPPVEATKIVYLALIEEEDQKSVQDLVALASKKDGAASAFTYGDKGWKEDQKVLAQLQSSAPPPIKQLEDWQTESIVDQISSTSALSTEAKAKPWVETKTDQPHDQPENPDSDPEVQASAAFDLQNAGVIWGPDNQHILSLVLTAAAAGHWTGNAQRLRDYWQTGKGGAKIRWNTPGDWTRCHRHLSKYLGPRAAGYCQLMHHRMTGMWTGDRAHLAMSGRV